MSRIPGVWSVREAYTNGEPCGFVVHSGAVDICDVEAQEDAVLISSAPDLFVACDEADTAFAVLNISKLTPQARGCVRKAWPMIQAARAKAKGSGIYADVIKEVHETEISRLDAVNSDLLKALSDLIAVINLDSDQEYFICSEAADIVEAAQQLVLKSNVI